jgi:hypothetical protein
MKSKQGLLEGILCYLCRQPPGERVPLAELCEELGVPSREPVIEILQQLQAQGYVEVSALTPSAMLCRITYNGRNIVKDFEMHDVAPSAPEADVAPSAPGTTLPPPIDSDEPTPQNNKPTKTGKELERRVANAYRQMGARKVEHDVELAGNQIDVYVELETPGRLLHRIAIEAKDWSNPVGIDIVNKFAIVADLLRRKRLIDEGVIVSTSGFSKQARNAARIHGIRLLEPSDLDVMIKEARGPGPILSTAPSTPTSTAYYAVHPRARTAQAASTASVGPTRDPAQAIPLSQQTEYQYDVFISYSHADQEWVWNELLPRLERVGLKAIIDYRDFEPGAPLIMEALWDFAWEGHIWGSSD